MSGGTEPKFLIAWHSQSRSGFRGLRLHSQISMTRQPLLVSFCMLRVSRSTVWRNLSAQNSVRVAGTVANLQPMWRCQKQPCTNMHVLYLARTISGQPGRFFTWILNLNPLRCRNRRTFNSGIVFFPLMLDIIRERVSTLTTSIFTSLLSAGYDPKLSHDE
jgi:hypothetical protein